MPMFRHPDEYATYSWFTKDELADPQSVGHDGPEIDRFDPDQLTPEYRNAILAGSSTGIPMREASATVGPTRTGARRAVPGARGRRGQGDDHQHSRPDTPARSSNQRSSGSRRNRNRPDHNGAS
jgi:hypothetical protein